MRGLFPAAIFVALGAGCSSSQLAQPAELIFPHEAVPIEGVCHAAPQNRALAVSAEAPFEHTGLRRFRLTNASAEPHEVHPEFVAMATAPCDRVWSLWDRLELSDSASCETPDAEPLAPSASLEIRIPPRKQRLLDGACTKIGLALYTQVDGQRACVELGSWIAYRHGDD